MRLVLLADTHANEAELGELPAGDVLVIAGDLGNMFRNPSYSEQLARLNLWLGQQPFAWRLVIGGNHDGLLQAVEGRPQERLSNAIWLCDSGVEIGGIKFWGAPWTIGAEAEMAFTLPEEKIKAKWALIPNNTEVLVTHGPPYGTLDGRAGDRGGDEELRDAVERVQPALHVFGHIHAGRGVQKKGRTLYVNACVSGEDIEVVGGAAVVDLVAGGNASVVSFGD
jgi:Icc-related predicted phosphoesterase